MENQDAQSIRKQIEVTRERIADTAEALAYKSDVPARLKEDVAERLDIAATTAAEATQTVSSVVAQAADTAKNAAQDASAAAKPALADAADTAARVKDAAVARIEAAKPAVANAAATVAAAGSVAQDGVAEFADKARATLAEANANLRGASSRTPLEDASAFIRAHPFTVTLATIALGFLGGIVLPGGKSNSQDDNRSPWSYPPL